jgi:Pilus formation protein N terminal region
MTIKYTLIATLAGLMLASPAGKAAAPERALHVATDNAEVVNLADTPAVVLVANPKIADVVVEQGHLIFVVGKQPGQTRLFVYGPDGKAILERDVVVVPPRDRAVTIIRVTRATDYSCDPRCVSLSPEAEAAGSGSANIVPAPSAPAAPAPALAPVASAPYGIGAPPAAVAAK